MKRYLGGRLIVQRGDITQLAVGAIVNAANNTLSGGGGVDGAIHRAAGPLLGEACRLLGGCATGEAKITRGFRLPAKHVIHTVGPIWEDGRHGEDDLLARAYDNSLKLAVENGIRTLAFPCISTGAYRFPAERASEIAVGVVTSFLDHHDGIEQVIFCCFDDEDYELYLEAVEQFV